MARYWPQISTNRSQVQRIERRDQPGVPKRFIFKVFDSESGTEVDAAVDGTEYLVRQSLAVVAS